MAKRIELFYFQGFIESENRGGDYHITADIDGVRMGPMTPAQADAHGLTLSAIFADIDMQLATAIDAARAETEIVRREGEKVVEDVRAETNAKLNSGRVAVEGANLIMQKMAAMLSPADLASITKDVEALNAAVAQVEGGAVSVAPIEGVADGKPI